MTMNSHYGSRRKKLNMYEPLVYNIRIQGELDEDWSEYFGAQSLSVEADEAGLSVTTIISEPVDQSALIGIINRLNNIALPLISVEYMQTPVENNREEKDNINQPTYKNIRDWKNEKQTQY